jgi:hypothetical protein
MQPQASVAPAVPVKPVMDATPPASQQIAVRQAPVEVDEEVAPASTATLAVEQSVVKPARQSPKAPAKQQKAASSQQLPAGLIVATVTVMVVLSALAVIIYVTSQK